MAAVDRSFLDDDSTPEDAPPRPSRVLTVFFGLIMVGGLASCCLCGFYFYSQWPEFHEHADEARALAEQLLPMDIPAVFEPRGTITWRIWPLMTMRGAYFKHSLGAGEISLLQINSAYLSQPGFRDHVTRSLQEQGAGGGFELAVRETSERSIDVYGRPVRFRFTSGEDRTSGAQRRLVDGVVEGADGPVLIVLWVDEENWSEEQVLGMLGTIGRRQD